MQKPSCLLLASCFNAGVRFRINPSRVALEEYVSNYLRVTVESSKCPLASDLSRVQLSTVLLGNAHLVLGLKNWIIIRKSRFQYPWNTLSKLARSQQLLSIRVTVARPDIRKQLPYDSCCDNFGVVERIFLYCELTRNWSKRWSWFLILRK